MGGGPGTTQPPQARQAGALVAAVHPPAGGNGHHSWPSSASLSSVIYSLQLSPSVGEARSQCGKHV